VLVECVEATSNGLIDLSVIAMENGQKLACTEYVKQTLRAAAKVTIVHFVGSKLPGMAQNHYNLRHKFWYLHPADESLDCLSDQLEAYHDSTRLPLPKHTKSWFRCTA